MISWIARLLLLLPLVHLLANSLFFFALENAVLVLVAHIYAVDLRIKKITKCCDLPAIWHLHRCLFKSMHV
jgi:hypothetical protein